ncbi:hypothetical protein [Aquimarina sediminis]|nr:hypothetical protein [Aquimarina sediminis]
MKRIQSILDNISKEIKDRVMQQKEVKKYKEILSGYENDENAFLFI